jgi:hypothetical protein
MSPHRLRVEDLVAANKPACIRELQSCYQCLRRTLGRPIGPESFGRVHGEDRSGSSFCREHFVAEKSGDYTWKRSMSVMAIFSQLRKFPRQQQSFKRLQQAITECVSRRATGRPASDYSKQLQNV